MHSKFLKISAAVFFAAALFSCSFDAPESDKGSISMRLPDKSQLGAACANGVSRSVSSDGSLSAGSVDQFKVVVRNISSRESITQFVVPGSSVTVDELEPGSWDVAIFGYANDPQGSGQSIRYYGNARGIPVEGGETSNATVNLYDISGNMPGFGFNIASTVNVSYAYINYSCDDLSQSGDAFYSFNASDSSYDSAKPLQPPLPIFMEPGYAYKVTANLYSPMGECVFTGTAQGTVPAGGRLVEGTLNAPTDALQATGTLNGHYVIGDSFADFVESHYPTFNYGSETIPCSNLSFKAINASACGLSVPYIASYGNSSYLIMPTVYHPVVVPTVSVPNQTVQKGQTITVSPSLSPSAPKAWPKLTIEAAVNGFNRYIVDSEHSDKDTWTQALSCTDTNANKVEFNDNTKTLTGKAAGSNSFAWTVTVTSGQFGETPAQNIATANFTATCVEAAQPSGGGGGNVPADFVLVQGDTINASFTGSILNGRTITIPDMYVCSHEVTQKEYSQYMITKGAATNNTYYDTTDEWGKGDNYPIYNIEWTEAVMYCNLRSEADGLDPAYYIVLGTNDTDSLNFTEGTRTYDVRDWKANWKSGTNDVIEEVDGKYYVARLQITQAMYAANRGITLDKTRNGYRLLTHAEWEYCARGGKDGIAGTQTQYSGSDTADSVAWYYNNSGDNGTSTNGKSHVVCTKDPNSLGIYDMSGNIAEMVHDWKGRTIDATTPETGFVYDSSDNRSMAAVGGSWYRGSNDSKVTGSSTYGMDYRDKDIGFRICCNKTSRTVGAFSGIWAKAPVAHYYLTTGDPINWLLQNNAAASSDYASFDSSKLVVKEIESGSLINTYTGAAGGTVTLTTQSNGILWHMTNTKTGTGYRTYFFIYDGVEVTRAFVNSNY